MTQPRILFLFLCVALFSATVKILHADVRLGSARLGSASLAVAAAAPVDPCAGTPAAGTVCTGGVVYVGTFDPGDGGGVKKYMTTPADSPVRKAWSAEYIATGAVSTTDGAANTTNLKNRGAGYAAATYCSSLSYGGYTTGWYLPAKDELNLLYINRVAIGGFDMSGALPASYYWSSTDNNHTHYIWRQIFSAGINQAVDLKTFVFSVRCVRRY